MALRKIESNQFLNADQGTLPYTLVRSRNRRTLVIRIEEDARIKVLAPASMPEKDIQGFIRQKTPWIQKHVHKIAISRPPAAVKTFSNGEEHFFLGRKYKLVVQEENGPGLYAASLKFNGLNWTAQIPQNLRPEERINQIKERLMIWYHLQAKEILGGRVFHYARLMNVKPQTITLRGQRRIWGSCDFRKKNISLNWQIIMSPPEVLDYVVVHELAHLIQPNHSPKFWQKVEEFHPGYSESRRWLKKHQKEILSVRSGD